MSSALHQTVQQTGEGRRISLPSGETLFALASHQGNPVVTPQEIGLTWREDGRLSIGAVFNGGAEVFEDKVVLLPRCHQGYRESSFFDKKLGLERRCLEDYVAEVWPLVSEDGICFTRLGTTVIRGDGTEQQQFTHGIEDIRIIRCAAQFLLIGCGKIGAPFKEPNADRIAVYGTADFSKITYHGMVESFDSRNAVPFSEPVEGKHYVLLRFHPNIHLDVLDAGMDQLLNPANHKDEWRRIYERRHKTLLFAAGSLPHEKEKIGPGTQVIKTGKGWLVIYHAVGELRKDIAAAYGLPESIERGYSICAALLDLQDPRKVLSRTRSPIYIPSAPYELYGDEQYSVDVPAVVFPVGAFCRGGKLMIYAGAGDKYVILLSCNLDKLLEHLIEHCNVNS